MLKTFLATLSPMFNLFLCIAIGFIARKAKLLPDNAGKVMAKMETWIFCPALSFMTMVRFCTVDTISTHATNIVLASISVSCAMAIAIPLAKLFVRQNTPERGVYAYALAFANSGYVGDPIVLALKSWVDAEYENGRQTMISDSEVEEKIAELIKDMGIPSLFN